MISSSYVHYVSFSYRSLSHPHLDVPRSVSFVSFLFVVEFMSLPIWGCTRRLEVFRSPNEVDMLEINSIKLFFTLLSSLTTYIYICSLVLCVPELSHGPFLSTRFSSPPTLNTPPCWSLSFLAGATSALLFFSLLFFFSLHAFELAFSSFCYLLAFPPLLAWHFVTPVRLPLPSPRYLLLQNRLS